jgi:arabinan endo-1,5-alpha-L-arabinosidase
MWRFAVKRRGFEIAVALLATSVLGGGVLAVPAAATTTQEAPAEQRKRQVAPDYQNPLNLTLPGGESVVSCADPDVIRGQEDGDTNWYLYCTTDPLTETERNAEGGLVFHNVPMFTSTDLVNWNYAGDAFPVKPSWVAPTGGIWAPEVAYSDGQYRLYYGASETSIAGGSSAIGVAVSDSPTGPWVDTGVPVVEPAASGRWQFDPEVLTTDTETYLYFGSYFGGIFARELSDDSLTSLPETETQIAIDNRYEGTVIVEHEGWYYFLGSATNCCNGPLTGYAVFAARSESPLGPFVDRNGVSILDSRVGGTPVLTQNGNRWVGPGHNTVFTDYDGQDWTIYHAVDQNDPYFAGSVGFTKRPALLDPLDWRRGWPVVRGGHGPSDEPVPGPAAQPGQRTGYRDDRIRDPRVRREYEELSDEFDGTALTPQWSWVRPEAASYTLTGESLLWQTQAADLHPPATPLASVLTEPAPEGDYVVETRVRVSTPAEGCCFNYVQGGIVIYGDDGNYVKLSSVSIWNTRQTEFGKQVSPVPEGYPSYGNTVVGPTAEWTYLRIVHREGGAVDRYTAFTSIDGENWDRGGTWTHDLGPAPKIGLISLGGAGFESEFDYVRVNTVRPER